MIRRETVHQDDNGRRAMLHTDERGDLALLRTDGSAVLLRPWDTTPSGRLRGAR